MSYVPKILIVDDEPHMYDSLKVLLGNEGYETQARHNGQQALEALAKDDYDLVLLDLVLPDISGAEIMDHINRQTPETFVIVITGHASLGTAIDSLKKGAFDYLTKPFEHEEVSKTVRNALDQKALKREQKRMEEALRESEEKYKTLVEGSMTGIFIHQDGKYVFVNDRFAEIHGYEPEELLGKEYLTLIHPDEREAARQIASKRLKGEAVLQRHEIRRLGRDGKTAWCEMMAGCIEYAGRPAIMGNIIDITERKLVEEALRQSEERFQQIAENAREWIWEVDANGLYTYASPIVEEILGYKQEEVVGEKHFYDLFHPEDREELKKAALKVFAEKQPFREFINRNMHKDGKIVWLLTSGIPALDEMGNLLGYRGADTDITAQKLSEEKLRESTRRMQVAYDQSIVYAQQLNEEIADRKRAEEALIRAKEDWENTFDAITDMVMLLDNEHHILRVNKAAAEALNTTKENLVGKKCYEAIHKQSHPIMKCPLVLTVKTLEPHTTEITEPHLDGTFICSTSPIVDREGKLAGYTHTLKDITKSKRLEAQFQQAQRLEAVGTLAGGIAHDFNNLLTGIQGNASLMLLNMDSANPYYERLKNIEKQVQSGARLTSHLLGHARRGKYEVKPVDLNQLVEETCETFGRTRKQIAIHQELADDLFAIEAESGQIEQVLWNLLVNAADAMPDGGDLFLKTMIVSHEKMTGKLYKPKRGDYALLTVADTGTGMDKETMERVFEPFFTTKEMGRGTGLGLASAYGILKAHRGYIDVESKKGQGTTFSIYLPLSKKKVEKAIKTAERFIKGTGTVLLVDDEDVIHEVGQDLLEAMGYRVLIARDGKEAIEVYKENRDEIDIVVLDMVMPKMGGGEAYDRMKEINPDIKVLLSSGFSIDGLAIEILNRGCDGFIQKPFKMKELSQAIRNVLGKE